MYEHDNQLYRRFKQKNNTFDLKCNVQHCDGSARLKNGIFECYTGRVKMQNGNPESYSECGLRNLWQRRDGYSRVTLRGVSQRMQFLRAASPVVI